MLGLRCCSVLSLVAASGGYSSLRCVGFSLHWLLLLQSTSSRHTGFNSCGVGSVDAALGLQSHCLSSCSTWVYLSCSTWDLPKSGIEPVSPALAGGFLTTGPPGKSDFMSVLVPVQPLLFLWHLCAWFIPFTFSLSVILDMNFVSGKLWLLGIVSAM